MEFSEDFELKRLSKSRGHLGENSPSTKIFKNHGHTRSLFTRTEPDEKLSDYLSSEKHLPSSLSKEDIDIDLVIEKDTSYLQEETKNKRSSLTILLQQTEDKSNPSPLKNLNLTIYFFRTLNKIQISVPKEIIAIDLIAKSLLTYEKTNYPRLPHGLDSQGYDLWIADEENCLPDTDYTIYEHTFISSLRVKTFCVVEKPGFRSSIFNSNNGSKIVIKNSKPGTVHTKFFFENSSAVIAVKPDDTLEKVLVLLWKKFYIFGDLSKDMFEFRVFVKEIGNECAVDMGLMIKELPQVDIRLYRKVLADTPKSLIHKKGIKSQFVFRNNGLM